MKWLFFVAAICGTAATAQVQQGDFFDEVQADLNGNGIAETYTLVRGPEDNADLIVSGDKGLTQTFPALVWAGAMAGTIPTLTLAENGSLRITHGNDSIGRGRWSEVLTVAYRNDRLTLAGLTYTWFDTMDFENRGTCDVNLLTGRGVFEQEGFGRKDVREEEVIALPLATWNYNRSVSVCNPIPTGSP